MMVTFKLKFEYDGESHNVNKEKMILNHKWPILMVLDPGYLEAKLSSRLKRFQTGFFFCPNEIRSGFGSISFRVQFKVWHFRIF